MLKFMGPYRYTGEVKGNGIGQITRIMQWAMWEVLWSSLTFVILMMRDDVVWKERKNKWYIFRSMTERKVFTEVMVP